MTTLKQGSTGPDVGMLQQDLNKNGASLIVDASFGPATDSALRAFQAQKGLVVDGEAGPLTMAAFATAIPPPASDHIPGADLSHWEKGASMPAIIGAGKKFLGVKISDGETYVDDTGQTFRDAAEAAGMPAILYHFFRFGADPIKQAQNFCKAVGKLRKGETICPDLEWDPDSVKYGAKTSTMDAAAYQMVLVFWKEVLRILGIPATFKCPLYTNPFFWMSKDPAPAEFADLFHYWAAGYVASLAKVVIPAPWKSIFIWQYSDSVIVQNIGAGIKGVDGDYFYGTQAELFTFMQQ